MFSYHLDVNISMAKNIRLSAIFGYRSYINVGFFCVTNALISVLLEYVPITHLIPPKKSKHDPYWIQ